MGPGFWIRRFFTVFLGAFTIIALAQALKGHPWSYALREGALWGALSAAVFTATRFFRARRGQPCAICQDTPAMQEAPGGDA